MTDYLNSSIDLNDPEIVSAYDELPLWSAMFGMLLLKHVPIKPGMMVLDVGCGTGFPLLELAQRLGSTCKVYGIDPWETALKRAAQKAQLLNVQNVELKLADAAALPFPDGHFDLIVSNLGVNNFDDPEAVVRECWRVTRPSAGIVLTTNLQGHMQEFYDVFESTLLELGKETAVVELKKHIEKRATIEKVVTLFRKARFRITTVHQASTVMRFADGSALLRHYFIKLGFLDAWKGVIETAEQVEVFTRMEENLNRLSEKEGELRLTIPMAYIEGERVGL
ncbi:methyltransferase domain-containing protein [bacterium]|nr:methyltransferase domain-containing protein [bacterium]MCI0605806.1 methyltransferase domain-containing protein [bacterium]